MLDGVEWPDSFYALKRGEGCPICAEGRPDESHGSARFFAGEVADAYLRREAIQRGYTIVTWRGRHVAEPTELAKARRPPTGASSSASAARSRSTCGR
jgi:hypothetical protein